LALFVHIIDIFLLNLKLFSSRLEEFKLGPKDIRILCKSTLFINAGNKARSAGRVSLEKPEMPALAKVVCIAFSL